MYQRSVARAAAVAVSPLRTRFLHTDSEVQRAATEAAAQPRPAPDAPDAPTTPEQPLVDTFGRRHNYLRISLTEKCNLRCTYCMPAGGVALSARARLLAPHELVALVRVFAALGVDKLRLTGGEPTLRKDLPELIQELKSIPGIRTVGMTSNGVALARRLPALQRAGLDALNLSLDTLQPARWERLTRRPPALLPRVLAAADTALQLGYTLKMNTVLVRGVNDDEMTDFVELARDRDMEVRFIEFMPFSGNEWARDGLLPSREALRRLAAHYELTPAPPRPNDTARMWQAAGLRGRVGFISSMTQHFCGSCNRLRLTADGSLKVCLFGAAEVSLRDALRAGAAPAQLAALVRAALHAKKKQHAGGQACAGRRAYSTLSHVDGAGRARMVDVGGKRASARAAAAACTLRVSRAALALLRDNALLKGDALTVAEIAGVMAAKRTAELIPLCHPLLLDAVRVRLTLPESGRGGEGGSAVRVACEVRCAGRTGAEMEALVGAALAALALYDMCKSADRHMRITDLRVTHKAGGKADFTLEPPAPPAPPTANTDTN